MFETKRCFDCANPKPCEVTTCDKCNIKCPGCSMYLERLSPEEREELRREAEDEARIHSMHMLMESVKRKQKNQTVRCSLMCQLKQLF